MKPTTLILNGVPQQTYKSITEAKKEGKRLIRAFKKQNEVFSINIQYRNYETRNKQIL